MSSISSYWIELRTGTDYSLETYDEAAGQMVCLLYHILSNRDQITQMVSGDSIMSMESEVEVSLAENAAGGRELVGKAVLDLFATKKLKLDKPKLSKLVRARKEADNWPNLKVLKKAVPDQ